MRRLGKNRYFQKPIIYVSSSVFSWLFVVNNDRANSRLENLGLFVQHLKSLTCNDRLFLMAYEEKCENTHRNMSEKTE